MKLVFLHGLGQRAHDWQPVVNCIPGNNVDCPELFLLPSGGKTYPHILASLEKRYAAEHEPLLLCGLSLGAVLALDYTIRHGDKVAGLVLIAPQYKVPGWLIQLQNWMFRCMSETAFADIGMTRAEVIALCGSMQAIDFTAQLYRLSCPVKLLCGGQDWANKAACRKLQKLLPQAELECMPGVGHEINREAPQALAAVVRQLQNKIMETAAGSSSALHSA